MLRRIEALGYRCFRHVEVELDDFQILVGPNAAGKSTLLDAILFLGEFVTDGLDIPIRKRTGVFRDLVWNRPVENPTLEIAVEVELPTEIRERLPYGSTHDRLRYEVAARQSPLHGPYISHERWFPVTISALPDRHTVRFPNPTTPPKTIFKDLPPELQQASRDRADWIGGHTNQPPPSTAADRRRCASSALGLSFSRSDVDSISHWLDRALWDVVRVVLCNSALRCPSPPDAHSRRFNSFGCNLPWLVQILKTAHPHAYLSWLAHVRCVIPELTSVDTVERTDDHHAYLVLTYSTGLRTPSCKVSDGTLRLLALTLLAYLPNQARRCIVEQPENGIHPLALDVVYDSLRSMDDSQVFVATHSPTLVRRAEATEILCFAKDADGATDIVRGDRHPRLRNWLDSADTSLVFATGVFG